MLRVARAPANQVAEHGRPVVPRMTVALPPRGSGRVVV
jgi:hypothetical protein